MTWNNPSVLTDGSSPVVENFLDSSSIFAIDLATMANCDDHDRQDVLVDRVDDSIVADADPIGIAAGEFASDLWKWVGG